MASTIRTLADRVWDHVLRTEPHHALRNGQPVERLPSGWLDETEERAAVGRSVREALDVITFAEPLADVERFLSPEEVHDLGLTQVAELTEQMAKVRAEVGFDGSEAAYRRVLEADERPHARSADDVAATYRRHLAAIEPLVGQWFSVLPKAGYEVERLDPELEAGLSYGYYEQPGPTTPAGRYRYNGSGLGTRSQINAASLIFHELVPGHHFHLARQEEDTGLHPVRGLLAPELLGTYTEGWAEYAASLGMEMGLYIDP